MQHSRQTDKNISMRITHASTKCLAGNDRGSPGNIKVELPAPREALILAGSPDELDDHWHGIASCK